MLPTHICSGALKIWCKRWLFRSRRVNHSQAGLFNGVHGGDRDQAPPARRLRYTRTLFSERFLLNCTAATAAPAQFLGVPQLFAVASFTTLHAPLKCVDCVYAVLCTVPLGVVV